jgi:hypothetical protein
MKKESRASKITSVFDNLDIDKLSSVASQMSTPSVSAPLQTPVQVPVQAPVEIEVASENPKKDRRFTIILPHDLYMKMVLKTKSEGISFTKYIHAIMEKDLS